MPDPPQASTFHLRLEGEEDELLEARDRVARKMGIWLFGNLKQIEGQTAIGPFEEPAGHRIFNQFGPSQFSASPKCPDEGCEAGHDVLADIDDPDLAKAGFL